MGKDLLEAVEHIKEMESADKAPWKFDNLCRYWIPLELTGKVKHVSCGLENGRGVYVQYKHGMISKRWAKYGNISWKDAVVVEFMIIRRMKTK